MILIASSTGTPAARGSGVGSFRSFRVTWAAAVSSDSGFHKERCIVHLLLLAHFY